MYRLGIWLVALALVFNGVAMNAWAGVAIPAGTIAQIQHADGDGMQCATHGDETAAVAQHSERPHGHMHDHLGCCGMCSVASVIPTVAVIAVAFSYRSAVFHVTQPHLVGHLVTLDPDIPKSIV